MTYNPDDFYFPPKVELNYSFNNDFMKNKLDFLTSARFWAMVVGALSVYLKMKGLLGDAEMQLIATITAGFVVVRTADRFGEQQVVSAGVSSGQVSASDVVGVPPEK